PVVAGELAGELRVAGRRVGNLAVGLPAQRDVPQRWPPRAIDLERALVRGQRDVRTPELFLQVAQPREQRLLPLGMPRGRGDLAPENHADALEIAALAPRVLERVERGQVRVGDSQRTLEAAHGVITAFGAPEQLAGAIHRVGAR